MTRFALILALAVTLTPAQERQRSVQQKIFQIKHADVLQLADLLSVFGVGIQKNPTMKVIAVTGPPESVAGVEDAIRRLDVPPPAEKNVEIVGYFLRAGQQAGAGKPLPADLEPVAKQLRSLFGFQTLHLLEARIVRVRDGEEAQTSGAADSGDPERPVDIELRLRPRIQSMEGVRSVRIDRLFAVVRIPYRSGMPLENKPQWSFRTAQFNTAIDIREGQKVVVGKSGVGGSNEALILVMTAKILD